MDSTERRLTLEKHQWASLTSEGHRQLTLPPAATYHIGIHGYADNTTVTWKSSVGSEGEEDVIMEEEPHANESGYVQCSNCKAWIPERTQMLHEGFCMRNNVVCPQGCGKIFKKGSQELEHHWHCDKCDAIGSQSDQAKHQDYFHTPKPCICQDFTADSYESLSKHRRTDCAERLITCRYCHVSESKA